MTRAGRTPRWRTRCSTAARRQPERERALFVSPHVSIVIPVFDEEAILHLVVVDLRERFAALGRPYEILLAENGSRDGTIAVAEKLEAKYSEVRHLSIGEPNYGVALRAGIESARGKIVICEEIDLCDVEFHSRAIAMLDEGSADMVIGSKLAAGAEDVRPRTRHLASLAYSALLRATLGFRGTDTHGLKAFDREALLPVVRACIVDKDVFRRAESNPVPIAWAKRIVELPVRVMEKRVPSINLVRRVPGWRPRLVKLWRAEPLLLGSTRSPRARAMGTWRR